ncbi:MAG: hypothetical protein QM820_00660 [Minicystis sp.]
MLFIRYTTIHELLALLVQWTGNLKPTFVSIPEIAGLQGRVQEDHDALLTLDTGAASEAAFVALQEAATPIDASHDHLQRGLRFGLLSAVEILRAQPVPDEALAEKIENAIHRLQPQGLEINKATHEAEVGHAVVMVKTAADPEIAAVLHQVPVMLGLTAADVVTRIGEVGAQLGDVEQQKSLAAKAARESAVPPAEVRRRQQSAADTIEAVLQALARSKAAPADIDAIRQPVLDTVEKTRARRLAQRAAAKKKVAEDAAAAEKAAQEKAAADKAAQDKAATEKVAQEKAAADKAAQDKAEKEALAKTPKAGVTTAANAAESAGSG